MRGEPLPELLRDLGAEAFLDDPLVLAKWRRSRWNALVRRLVPVMHNTASLNSSSITGAPGGLPA